MKAYHDIVKKVLEEGELKETRQGIDTKVITGVMFEHDMSEGFPLLTTKSVPMRLIASELEFFIKGITDKQWLIDRNNHIWDEWAHPKKAPYGHSEEAKKAMLEETDLGAVYGFQWRHYNAEYIDQNTDYTGKGVDQLKYIIDTAKENPNSRRMIVNAWNPSMLSDMGLPPCHYCFQITVVNGRLNLLWNQRSVDTMLGLPFNIASYALLLHLLAKETGLKEGKLVGFLSDVHIFENHFDGAEEQLSRGFKALPSIKTEDFTSIFDWEYKNTEVEDYDHHPRIKFDIAI